MVHRVQCRRGVNPSSSIAYLVALLLVACGGSTGSESDPGNPNPSRSTDTGTSPTPSTCSLAASTKTIKTTPSGCAVLERDTSACRADREAQGISGFWLSLSCRVTLTVEGNVIVAKADGQPDYASNYFTASNACHEEYSAAITNPNRIAELNLSISFPRTPTESVQQMRGAIVGLALNGVPIFANFAAPGDDIFAEAKTFDRCGAHPQQKGVYHYHSEPLSISYDDASFIGVMRDGYAIYGRHDADGSIPELDAAGGHVGTTPDSATPVYHYHVNEQTSTNRSSLGEKQFFLTKGSYHGAPGTCSGCM